LIHPASVDKFLFFCAKPQKHDFANVSMDSDCGSIGFRIKSNVMKTFLLRTIVLSAMGLAPILHAAEPSTAAVFRVSEGVRPGAVFSLYGEYLNEPGEVRFLDANNSILATQQAVQIDPDGHFLRAVFPNIAPGVYRLSVHNSAGWSEQPIYINRADPRWLSDDRAYPGMKLKLLGRNLDVAEFGNNIGEEVTGTTQIMLSPADEGGRNYAILPDAVNPYCVDFSITDRMEPGIYQVAVYVHGNESSIPLTNRSEYPETPEHTILTIEPAPQNPQALALNVSWSNDFNWAKTVNIKTDCGAKGDASDETAIVKKALESLGKEGGVVFFPKGVYGITQLDIPSGCILLGESQTDTVLLGKASHQTIRFQGERHGIASMTLRYHPDVPPKEQTTFLTGDAKKLFIHRITFDFLREPDILTRYSPYYVKGDGPMLVAECRFFKNIWNHEVKNRQTFRNNYIEMRDGLGFCMSSEKLLLLNNELVFKPAEYAGQMNGFFVTEGWMGWNIYNAYIAENHTRNLDGPGDCQPFALDSAWSCFAGAVTDSTAKTITVRNDLDAAFKVIDRHELEVLIVQGKGLGQLRRAVSFEQLGGEPESVRLTVAPAWDVEPDETSVAAVGSWHVNNVFYKNVADVSKSPYNMYYGGCYDCVDSDAVSSNTEGWYNWGRIGEVPNAPGNPPHFGKCWHTPVYFSQLKRSTFTGKSPPYDTMGVILRVENESQRYIGVGDYGAEIRDNVIDRSDCRDRPQRLGDKAPAAIATFVQRWEETTGAAGKPALLATLCDGNVIKNSVQGFNLSRCTGFLIHRTTYENCETPVVDKGIGTKIVE
jgi:hypothetical protein